MNSSGFSSASSSFMDSSYDQISDSDGAKLEIDLASPNHSSSLHFSNPSSAASSVHNTDDEDDDSSERPLKFRQKRREAHTLAEKRRRDNIKKGYDELQTLVPKLHSETVGSQKVSKAVMLQRSIDYIEYLEKERKKQTEDLEKLRKKEQSLSIMKSNYEQIVKAHQSNPANSNHQLSDQVKFEVFQRIMDTLFVSFNSSISVASFQELSHCVFSWIEEQCTPQSLRDIVIDTLKQLNPQLR
ncbi:max-like protein X [Styela clava]|uniref:max-like protein X n=1 Tax=Styela clava TaxID=7725 RepID=UPI00193941D9|nr:max-like protein X [Styela clava]